VPQDCRYGLPKRCHCPLQCSPSAPYRPNDQGTPLQSSSERLELSFGFETAIGIKQPSRAKSQTRQLQGKEAGRSEGQERDQEEVDEQEPKKG